jgi:hypothetical protein
VTVSVSHFIDAHFVDFSSLFRYFDWFLTFRVLSDIYKVILVVSGFVYSICSVLRELCLSSVTFATLSPLGHHTLMIQW